MIAVFVFECMVCWCLSRWSEHCECTEQRSVAVEVHIFCSAALVQKCEGTRARIVIPFSSRMPFVLNLLGLVAGWAGKFRVNGN